MKKKSNQGAQKAHLAFAILWTIVLTLDIYSYILKMAISPIAVVTPTILLIIGHIAAVFPDKEDDD